MVGVDILACLDYLVWLRTGEEVASRLKFSQSTVSRNFNKCCDEFGLQPYKGNGEYKISGDLSLLNLQRKVHQYHRWQGGRPLRIEGMYWSGGTYLSDPIEGFVAGNHDFLSVAQPLQLLRDGVIDAWVSPYPDCPDEDDMEFACHHLAFFPCHLVAVPSHPLFSIAGELTLGDIMDFPSLALPEGAFPIFEAYARQQGLWNTPSRILRYKQSKWDGRTETELSTTFSSVFALQLHGDKQRVLPYHFDLEVGDCLVVRREFADHPQTQFLRHALRARLLPWAEKYHEIKVCDQRN